MKRMNKLVVGFSFSCLIASLGSDHAIAKPKNTVRVKTELVSPAARYQNEDDVEFTFVNRTDHRAVVRVRVIDEGGQRVEVRKFLVEPGASIRKVFLDEGNAVDETALLRFEIESIVGCEENPSLSEAKSAVFVTRGVRRSGKQFREVLVSSIQRPCLEACTPRDTKPAG